MGTRCLGMHNQFPIDREKQGLLGPAKLRDRNSIYSHPCRGLMVGGVSFLHPGISALALQFFFCQYDISQCDMSRVLKCACMIGFAPGTSLTANAAAACVAEGDARSKPEPDLQLGAKFRHSSQYQPNPNQPKGQ